MTSCTGSLISMFGTRMCGQTLLFIVIANGADVRPACVAMTWIPESGGRTRGRLQKTWRTSFKEDLDTVQRELPTIDTDGEISSPNVPSGTGSILSLSKSQITVYRSYTLQCFDAMVRQQHGHLVYRKKLLQ